MWKKGWKELISFIGGERGNKQVKMLGNTGQFSQQVLSEINFFEVKEVLRLWN